MSAQNDGLKMNIEAGRAVVGGQPCELEQAIFSEFTEAELQQIVRLLAQNPLLMRYIRFFTNTSERLYLKQLADEMEERFAGKMNQGVTVETIIEAFRKSAAID